MDFRDYLRQARILARGPVEADWRTASSRAYYAAFHVARLLLRDLGFRVPQAERAHNYLSLRLFNSGHADTSAAGRGLNGLRGQRNRADYNDQISFTQAMALRDVQQAEDVVLALDAAAIEPIRTQITDAMKVYERDILHDVTWHP